MPIVLSNFPGGRGAVGVPLNAVSNIKTLVSSGKVYVSWDDPSDIILEGSELATWSGTLLVRKAGSMPTNRRDGTIVLDSKERNAYSSAYFCDSGLTDGVTYYYKFFPYTTANVYTESEDNEFNATPTAQVAGIDSWSVTSMSASSEAGDGKITVTWTDPASTITYDGVILATWASTTIVVKAGSYATSKDDADAAYTLKVTTRNQYSSTALTISGLTNGTKYYISFFPETTDGGINTSTSQRTTGTANRITIENVPSQSGSLTYSGSEQTPSWSNYNTTYMTIGGTTNGTNAGSYTATFTPTTDYRWSDGTTTAKSVTWSIGKAAGSLTLSASSVTLDASNLTQTVTVTRAGDGIITATSNNTGVATVSVSGNTITISHVNKTTGSATITVEVAAGTNHTAPSNKTIAVTAQFASSILNDNDWATISDVAASGIGDNYWDVGDCKAVSVSGTVGTQSISGTYYVYILGFAHNGATGTIDFGTFKTSASGGTDICLVDSYYDSNGGVNKCFNMNHDASATTIGGWKGCDIRYDILGSTNTYGEDAGTTTATSPVSGTLMAALPSDLRAVMKPMTVYTDNTGGANNDASSITTSVDYLPLLAEYEICGIRTYANNAEQNYQEQYSYYSSGNSKVKYIHSETGSKAYWWERSPTYYSKNTFCYINKNGYPDQLEAWNSGGLAPVFRV